MKSTPLYTKLAHISILVLGFIAVLGKSILAPFIIAMLFAVLLITKKSFIAFYLLFLLLKHVAAVHARQKKVHYDITHSRIRRPGT